MSSADLEAWLEFRRLESAPAPKLVCTECGGRAEGNACWTDGSGEICDACVRKSEEQADAS